MLSTAFGESAMSKIMVYKLYKHFQDGCEDVEDDECTCCPSTLTNYENMKKVEEMIMKDRWITIKEVADDVTRSIGSRRKIFTSVLDMKRVTAKFVPKVLNFEQKSGKWKLLRNL